MRLVESVLDLLFPPRDTELVVRTLEPSSFVVAPLALPSKPYETTALLAYRDTETHAAIVEAKFYGNEKAFKLLGGIVHDYLLEWSAEGLMGETFVVVPVPLSSSRKRERGYNQVLRICEHVRVPGMKLMPNLVERVRDTAPQTSKNGAARRGAMQGAFKAQELDVNATYIVIDDVTTTGATLSAVVEALMHKGATRIIPLAVAH